MSDPAQEILRLTRRLLQSVAEGDWDAYQQLCDVQLTAFEPEARGQLVEGLHFHRFYFDLGGRKGSHNTTLAAPQVKLLGDDAAIVCYIRLVQYIDRDGAPQTDRFEETRVWQKKAGGWRNVHFHRSISH